ncbi:MAG TPA: hypothetical protein EYP65_02355 [Armatimonadetes bacterium]|nr:hypothetical protein [Armatimonadota bacterium]
MRPRRSKGIEVVRSLLEEASEALKAGDEWLLRGASRRMERALTLLGGEALHPDEAKALLKEAKTLLNEASSKLRALSKFGRGKGGGKAGFIDFEV